ncbi:membrane associated rhomboid family serine protease [Brevibacterium sanguinis]|uniref:Membrane associated rhomboid family serine protease n=2 Tax=Brevibacterium TaxID=1696 RepID=A0A366IGP6_9MICO|nr:MULTISPECIES: rhomboid family intramembrane serine protease [Brevibacterium]RBP63668.1 membrane associated rhomboid family serine protease [Brevibacterium sanguinis]RBP70327.1 membrane associated rhomboid family serine protease [Brevibacterium celere]
MRSHQSPQFSAAETRYLFGTDSAPRPSSQVGAQNAGLRSVLDGDHGLSRFVPVFVLLAIMWVVEIVDTLLPVDFDLFGLESWNPLSLYGLVTSPLLHSGFNHLTANTFPFLVLGIFIAMEGSRRFWTVSAITALVSGLGAWLTTLPGHHIVGASGIVFGFFGYLAMRTWYVDDLLRKIIYFAIGLFVFVTYGAAMVFGMLPQANGVSWQGHLFGFIGGLVAARLVHRRARQS